MPEIHTVRGLASVNSIGVIRNVGFVCEHVEEHEYMLHYGSTNKPNRAVEDSSYLVEGFEAHSLRLLSRSDKSDIL
jgi:hypothetical protein